MGRREYQLTNIIILWTNYVLPFLAIILLVLNVFHHSFKLSTGRQPIHLIFAEWKSFGLLAMLPETNIMVTLVMCNYFYFPVYLIIMTPKLWLMAWCYNNLPLPGWKMLEAQDIPNTAEGIWHWYTPLALCLEYKFSSLIGSPLFSKYSGFSWKDFEETRNWCICRGAEAASSRETFSHLYLVESKFSFMVFLTGVSLLFNRKPFCQTSLLCLTGRWLSIISLVPVNFTPISGQYSWILLYIHYWFIFNLTDHQIISAALRSLEHCWALTLER